MRASTLLIVLSSLCLSACGGGGGGGRVNTDLSGRLTLGITDGPVETASEVVVAFDGVVLQPAQGDRQDIALAEPLAIDLLDYQDGERALLLDERSVEPGEYNWLRLQVVEAESYILIEGQQFPLEIPSGEQSGLQLNRGFTVAAGAISDFTIEFDLRKSLTVTGNNRYILRPTLRIVDTLEAGSIAGEVAAGLVNATSCSERVNNETGNAVYLFAGEDTPVQDIRGDAGDPLATATVSFDNSDRSWRFRFGFVAAGDYRLAFTCDAAFDDPEQDDSDRVFFSEPAAVSLDTGGEASVTLQ